MKKIVFFLFLAVLTAPVFAQVDFDLGLKGGANFAKMSFDKEGYNEEAVLKSHFGAFARIGGGRVFIQPEAYYSGKGGDLTSDFNETRSSFNYETIDVPVLLGYRIVKNEGNFGIHVVAGPVFSGITTKKVNGENVLDKIFYEDHFFNIQYGLGIDVLFFTLDARFEQGMNDTYKGDLFKATNKTFMVSLGIKIL